MVPALHCCSCRRVPLLALVATALLLGLPACRRAAADADTPPPAAAKRPVATAPADAPHDEAAPEVATPSVANAYSGYQKIAAWDPSVATGTALVISIGEQVLHLFKNGKLIVSYPVSTSKYGIGNRANSNQTPLGLHRIKSKIGDRAPFATVFASRRATSQIATIITDPVPGAGDQVTTRILWLDGQEDGKNRGGAVDSYSRCIYIHGTPEEGLIGQPASHGCIRMTNGQVIHLFGQVAEGTPVLIQK